jgi:hypothetical protein
VLLFSEAGPPQPQAAAAKNARAVLGALIFFHQYP